MEEHKSPETLHVIPRVRRPVIGLDRRHFESRRIWGPQDPRGERRLGGDLQVGEGIFRVAL